MFSPSNTELSPFCIIVLLFFLFEIAVAQMHDKTSHPAKNVMSQINRQGSFGTNELILYDTNYIMISWGREETSDKADAMADPSLR